MIDFSTLQGLTIPEGVVTKIESGGVVLWMLQSNKPIILEVEKITSDTYAGETTYTGEQFILLDIYPKTNGTVSVTYGGLTKTITDTSGAEEPNAQQVFFGTFNGVSDNVATPASGTLTIEGDYSNITVGTYQRDSKAISPPRCGCVTAISDLGSVKQIISPGFASCTKLKSVVIPPTVKSIGNSFVFMEMEGVFYNCTQLTDVFISEGVREINNCAFSQCKGLTNFVIPSTVNLISPKALNGVNSTKNASFVTIDSNNPKYKMDGNSLINIESDTLIMGFLDSVIPSYIKTIGKEAFDSFGITTIEIPNSVIDIDNYAFGTCPSLTSITIPDGVTRIGDSAFYACSNLSINKLPNELTYLGKEAFRACRNISIDKLPDGLTYLGNDAFTIPSENPEQDGAQINTSRVSLTFSTLPSGLTYIGTSCCEANPVIETVEGLNNLTAIGAYAFHKCTNLTKVVIGNNVTTIGDNAFAYSNNLVDITIGTNIKTIGEDAFHTFAENIKIRFLSNVPPTFKNAWPFGTDTYCTIESIIVPVGCAEAYKAVLVKYVDYIVEVS